MAHLAINLSNNVHRCFSDGAACSAGNDWVSDHLWQLTGSRHCFTRQPRSWGLLVNLREDTFLFIFKILKQPCDFIAVETRACSFNSSLYPCGKSHNNNGTLMGNVKVVVFLLTLCFLVLSLTICWGWVHKRSIDILHMCYYHSGLKLSSYLLTFPSLKHNSASVKRNTDFPRNVEHFVAINLKGSVKDLDEWNPTELPKAGRWDCWTKPSKIPHSCWRCAFFHGTELFPLPWKGL